MNALPEDGSRLSGSTSESDRQGPDASPAVIAVLSALDYLSAGREIGSADLGLHRADCVGADLTQAEKTAFLRHPAAAVASHFAMLLLRDLPQSAPSELTKLLQAIAVYPTATSVERAVSLLERLEPDELLPEFLESLFDMISRDGQPIGLSLLTSRSGRAVGSNLPLADMARFLDYPEPTVNAHFATLLLRSLRDPVMQERFALPPEDSARLFAVLERLRLHGADGPSCEEASWAMERLGARPRSLGTRA